MPEYTVAAASCSRNEAVFSSSQCDHKCTQLRQTQDSDRVTSNCCCCAALVQTEVSAQTAAFSLTLTQSKKPRDRHVHEPQSVTDSPSTVSNRTAAVTVTADRTSVKLIIDILHSVKTVRRYR